MPRDLRAPTRNDDMLQEYIAGVGREELEAKYGLRPYTIEGFLMRANRRAAKMGWPTAAIGPTASERMRQRREDARERLLQGRNRVQVVKLAGVSDSTVSRLKRNPLYGLRLPPRVSLKHLGKD